MNLAEFASVQLFFLLERAVSSHVHIIHALWVNFFSTPCRYEIKLTDGCLRFSGKTKIHFPRTRKKLDLIIGPGLSYVCGNYISDRSVRSTWRINTVRQPRVILIVCRQRDARGFCESSKPLLKWLSWSWSVRRVCRVFCHRQGFNTLNARTKSEGNLLRNVAGRYSFIFA